ncbi:glycerate kinase [Candidatus Bathyarchaeota archaeon]|nr:glycerate kinase [Candidatus Bathyarchaeota archaeon]
MRSDACDIFEAALKAVDPEQSVFNALRLDGESLLFEGAQIDLSKVDRIFVIGGGKAGGLMARAVEALLRNRISSGYVNVLRGTEGAVSLNRINLNGTQHPTPSTDGVAGVERMLRLTENLSENDLVITLISGGGSSLMPLPAEGISLGDLQSVTNSLLRAGVTINELNAVRKHLSGFKGGLLASHCYPARVLSLILSDVIGDPLDTIASGPTAPDSSTFIDAQKILEKYQLQDTVPASVSKRISDGVAGVIPETPKKDDPIFNRVTNLIIANNSIAAAAAQRKSSELGYNSMILSTYIEGEARVVGSALSGVAKEILFKDRPVERPASVIIGGETTVTVRGKGKGGRNQELALGASFKIAGLFCVLAALGTDGIDGPTDAAGAIVDGDTLGRAADMELMPLAYLAENDSYSFFEKLGDCIITGPTGTNVNDLTVILLR